MIHFQDFRSVTQFARRAQLGELVDFDRETNHSDGVFRSMLLDFEGLVCVCPHLPGAPIPVRALVARGTHAI